MSNFSYLTEIQSLLDLSRVCELTSVKYNCVTKLDLSRVRYNCVTS